MYAIIESTHDDGSPETLRDEHGGRWRIAIDAADGTLAVERIDDYGGGSTIPAVADCTARSCGIARWFPDGTITIYESDTGENHTDPDTYGVNCEGEFVATSSGWQAAE